MIKEKKQTNKHNETQKAEAWLCKYLIHLKTDLQKRGIKQYPSPVISECNLLIPLTAEQTLLKAMKIKLRRPCTAFTTPIRSKQDVNCPLKHDNATARRLFCLLSVLLFREHLNWAG